MGQFNCCVIFNMGQVRLLDLTALHVLRLSCKLLVMILYPTKGSHFFLQQDNLILIA